MVLKEICYEYSFILQGTEYSYIAERELQDVIVYHQINGKYRKIHVVEAVKFSFEEFQEFCQDHAGLTDERNRLLQERDSSIPICCVVL